MDSCCISQLDLPSGWRQLFRALTTGKLVASDGMSTALIFFCCPHPTWEKAGAQGRSSAGCVSGACVTSGLLHRQ